MPSNPNMSSTDGENDDLGPHFIEHRGRIYSSLSTAIYPLPSDPEESEVRDRVLVDWRLARNSREKH